MPLADRPTAQACRRRNPLPGPLTFASYSVDAALMLLERRGWGIHALCERVRQESQAAGVG
jgi:hypothetical protein